MRPRRRSSTAARRRMTPIVINLRGKTLPRQQVRGASQWASSCVTVSARPNSTPARTFGRRGAPRVADFSTQHLRMAILVRVGKVEATAARSRCANALGRWHRIWPRGSGTHRAGDPGIAEGNARVGLVVHVDRRTTRRFTRSHWLLAPDSSSLSLSSGSSSIRRGIFSTRIGMLRTFGHVTASTQRQARRGRSTCSAMLTMIITLAAANASFSARSGR